MTRTKTTTTPTNKNNTAQKVNTSKGKKSRTTPPDTDEVEASESPRLQTTIGEQLAAKGAKPANEVQIINFDRRLPVALTPGELKDRAKRIQELRRTVKQSEMMLENETKDYKKRKESLESNISRATAEINELADQIGDEAEYRDVRCQRVFDYQLMQVREIRTDTQPPKLLQEPRPMTAREVEDGYTNADGERKPASPMQAQSRSGDDADVGGGIVDDDYLGDNDDPELDLD